MKKNKNSKPVVGAQISESHTRANLRAFCIASHLGRFFVIGNNSSEKAEIPASVAKLIIDSREHKYMGGLLSSRYYFHSDSTISAMQNLSDVISEMESEGICERVYGSDEGDEVVVYPKAESFFCNEK